MKRFDRLEHPRRYILLEALAAVAFACATFGELPSSQSNCCVSGQVPANSRPTTFKTSVRTHGAESANDAGIVFAAVKGDLNLRSSSAMTGSLTVVSALTGASRLLTGLLEKGRPARVIVVTATIGIRN